MFVDYDNFGRTFSKSRKNMKWEEIDYFISSYISWIKNKNILDLWCGSWRLLEHLSIHFPINDFFYNWVDISSKMLSFASQNFPTKKFVKLNMIDIDKFDSKKFDCIFFIASFHHIDKFEDRLTILKKSFSILKKWWIIFFTNWSLNSDINNKKYKSSIIKWSENEFWSLDYDIKIWKHNRYYHCFSLIELEFLFKKSWFSILENRVFDNKKNIISIVRKI